MNKLTENKLAVEAALAAVQAVELNSDGTRMTAGPGGRLVVEVLQEMISGYEALEVNTSEPAMCIDCGAELTEADDVVPDVDDDPSWDALIEVHDASCFWVWSRANRIHRGPAGVKASEQ